MVRFRDQKAKPIQTERKSISDYPCVFESAVYNLLFRQGKIRNSNGDFSRWQMHREQMQ
jgi:hypothetical protein